MNVISHLRSTPVRREELVVAYVRLNIHSRAVGSLEEKSENIFLERMYRRRFSGYKICNSTDVLSEQHGLTSSSHTVSSAAHTANPKIRPLYQVVAYRRG